MPRAKSNVCKLQKTRYSYHLNLPAEIIRELGWQEHQKVVAKKSGRQIIIKDWRPGKRV